MNTKTTARLNGIPLSEEEVKVIFRLGREDELELNHYGVSQ